MRARYINDGHIKSTHGGQKSINDIYNEVHPFFMQLITTWIDLM